MTAIPCTDFILPADKKKVKADNIIRSRVLIYNLCSFFFLSTSAV